MARRGTKSELEQCKLSFLSFFYLSCFITFIWTGTMYIKNISEVRSDALHQIIFYSHASSKTQPNQAPLLLNTARIQPGRQPHQCGGGYKHLSWQPWRTAPGLSQESLVRDETRTSLPAKSLTRTTLGQLCVAPQTSRSRPVTTEPGREPRVSDGTAGTAVQCP